MRKGVVINFVLFFGLFLASLAILFGISYVITGNASQIPDDSPIAESLLISANSFTNTSLEGRCTFTGIINLESYSYILYFEDSINLSSTIGLSPIPDPDPDKGDSNPNSFDPFVLPPSLLGPGEWKLTCFAENSTLSTPWSSNYTLILSDPEIPGSSNGNLSSAISNWTRYSNQEVITSYSFNYEDLPKNNSISVDPNDLNSVKIKFSSDLEEGTLVFLEIYEKDDQANNLIRTGNDNISIQIPESPVGEEIYVIFTLSQEDIENAGYEENYEFFYEITLGEETKLFDSLFVNISSGVFGNSSFDWIDYEFSNSLTNISFFVEDIPLEDDDYNASSLNSVWIGAGDLGLENDTVVFFEIYESDGSDFDNIRTGDSSLETFVEDGQAFALWTITQEDLENAGTDDEDYNFFFKFIVQDGDSAILYNQILNVEFISSNSSNCTPDWDCGSWGGCGNLEDLNSNEKSNILSECSLNDISVDSCGYKTKTCIDLNSCGSFLGKPSEIQYCSLGSSGDSNGSSNQESNNSESSISSNAWFWIIIAVIVALIILMFVIFFRRKRGNFMKDKPDIFNTGTNSVN